MKTIYKKTENVFEKFSEAALKVFGSSITFILAVIIVIVYFFSTPFARQSFHNSIYDIILCFTFLGFLLFKKHSINIIQHLILKLMNWFQRMIKQATAW